MACMWGEFVKLQNKVQGYSCEKCEEPTNKCPFYMPVCEFKEYIAVN